MELETRMEFKSEFGFEVFGEVDYKDGKPTSALPSWYYDQHINEEAKEIEHQKFMLESGQVHAATMMTVKQEVANRERSHEGIKNAKPVLTSDQKSKVKTIYGELGKAIRSTMFTKDAMTTGEASAQEEYRRSMTPVIEIKHRPSALWMLGCNCDVEVKKDKFYASRNNMDFAYKIAGRLIDEPTTTEHLRPKR